MKIKLIAVIVVVLSSCTSEINRLTTGYYESICFLQRYPHVIMRLTKDKSFKYKFAYLDDNVEGKWELHGDTLFLTSGFFDKKFQKSMMPSYKYTEYSDKKDAFLIKGGKLYKIDSLGQVIHECYLKRSN